MVETFQKAVAEYGMVTTLLLAMVAGMAYVIWRKLIVVQPKTNGKRSTSADKTNSIMQAISTGDKDLRTVIDENAKEGRHLSESLRDDLDDTRRELKGDIKSVSDDVKSEIQTRRMDVISLHQKIDADKKRK
jgi:cytoskeletal protein RodZ